MAAAGVAKSSMRTAPTRAPGVPEKWAKDNPSEAAEAFAAQRSDFVLESPPRAFTETKLAPLTYWPSAYLRRIG